MNTVLENIAARTSVRRYSQEPVPEEMVDKLLRAAMAAPSAKNLQPWEFIVVRDRAKMNELAEKLPYAKMLADAQLGIVVCGWTEYRFWEQDCAAATENLLLAATSLGLGAVWTAAADDERAATVRECLPMPEGVRPFCVIPIGFPAGEVHPKDKWKAEKVHWEKW